GNAEGAPTETYATGAISVGPVRPGQIVIPPNRIEVGDGRVVSDAPTAAPVRAPNATVTMGVGDSRIKSNASPNASSSAGKNLIPVAQGVQLALIPRAPETVQNAMRIVTQEMIESAQGGRSGGLDLAALAAIGLGAVQTTAFAAPGDFVQQSASAPTAIAPESMQWAFANVSGDGATLPSGINSAANGQLQKEAAPVTFKHVDLGSFTSEAPREVSSAPLNPFSGPSIVATLIVEGSSDLNASDDGVAQRNQTPKGFHHGVGNDNEVIPLDYPKVRGETLGGMEDLVLRMDSSLLLANDSTLNVAADPTQPTLRIVSVGQPEHGQISLQTHTDAQGRVTTEVLYAPERDFHGTVSFSYTVSDQYGLSRSATATLQVAAVNDAPVTSNENARIDEDTGLMLDAAQLLANDWDADTATDGQVLRISRVGDAQHGTSSLDAQGNIRFVPDVNYHGPAQLTYWVSDGAGGETPATVNLLIAAVNDLPVTVDESATGAEDVGLIFTQALLLANDSDPDAVSDGQVLTVSRVGDAQHGTTWLDAQGNVRFAPDANYHGPAQFNYWVSDGDGGETIATVHFVLTSVNDAPVTADESASGSEDLGLVFTAQQLLANDSDPDTATDGQVLTIGRIGGAQHGTAWLDGTGNVRFMPDTNYHGAAGFNYWVTDNAGLETMASVNLTIASVNDLPVVTGETVNSNEDVTLLFSPATLLANDTDTDGNALSISAVGNATHGTVSLVGGQVQFIPDANFNGTAGFSYTVNDGDGGLVTGTVVLNLAPVNDIPVVQDDAGGTGFEGTPLHISFASLLANDSDVDVGDTLTIDAVGSATHGTVAIVGGQVVFTPDAGYHGPASFVYRVRDAAGAQATGLATLNFSGVNDMPVAVGETISSNEDTTLLISSAALLQNDTDPDIATDGQVLSLVAVSNPQHGSVTLLGNGTIQFIPDPDFYGNASFVYTISDGVGGTAQSTATIAISNDNDAPVATGETVSGQAGQVLTISAAALLLNEYDSDNSLAQLTIQSVQSGVGGTVALNGSGDVVFTPQGGFTGTATFTYSVSDPSGATSNTVTASIVLSAAPNTSPTVQGEIVNGASEDAVFHISRATLLANDSDLEDSNAVLSIVLVGGASNGSVALDGNGDIVFTPDLNFNGAASFQYQVRDSLGAGSATVQAIIPVGAVNDLPVAVDDQFQTYKNSTMSIAFSQLTGNDSDADGDTLTVGGVRNASHGTVNIIGGNVQFIPTAGYTGVASFEYLSDDGNGGQTWATAQVTVSNPPNLYPSMTVSYLNFYPTGSTPGNLFDIAQANMTPSDDGNVGAMTIQYLSGSYQVRADSGHAGWQPLTGVNVNIFNYSLTSFHLDVQRVDALAAMQTSWTITDDQGLVNIWHFDYSVAGGLNSYMEYTGYAPPLVLALNNMPSEYISTRDSNVFFDMNGDGVLDKLAWAAAGSGVLGIDLNGDGRISNASEFAFKQYVNGAQTDLEGLVAFDTNHNGTLDSGDAQWDQFGVWEDKDADGQTQVGEYKTLDDLGIASIDLHSNAQMHTPTVANGANDVVVMGEGTFKRTDGSTGVTSDAMFTYQSGEDASAADIARMAHVFNQFSNVQFADEAHLGFVPWNDGMHLHATAGLQHVEDHAIRSIG
ncbi:MAG: cadherin-like domain-containing protein, partial [Rhodoferax sp.]|nr:cadherin-like domain-containing protein [Rhodoferax sp.]